jgi:transcriptional regulator with XRE-family HTH domain
MPERKKNALLDYLLERYKISNDLQLAKQIKYDRTMLYQVRNGKAQVGDEMRCAIARRFNMSLKKIDELAPPKEKNHA